MRYTVVVGLAVLLSIGCADSSTDEPTLMANAPTTAADATPVTLTGTVLEQIPAGPYVYVHLASDSGDVWAAVNEAPLTVGASITVNNVMVMEDFESPTLGRTFDRIYFGSLNAPDDAADFAHGTPLDAPVAMPTSETTVGPVERASGNDARSIGELWTQKEQLAGSSVSIRGVVVKYNAGVMGKNWIHLQDGSGDAANGTNDITATSMDEAAVGDTVTVSGTVRMNRDFGAGYVYPLVVEDARIVVR